MIGGWPAEPYARSLFATAPGQPPIIVTIDGTTVMSLVDRSFGGAAGGIVNCPSEFPASARHMISRLETMVLGALQRALNATKAGAIQLVRRDPPTTVAPPFAPDHRVAELMLSIVEPGQRPWTIGVTLSCAALDQMFGHGKQGAPGAALTARSGDPEGCPWGDISLPLTAVLVEMNLPLSAMSELRPDQLIPVTVPRTLPLLIGRRCVARGTVGAMNGQLALQLSSIA
jgi:flagellar motor switch protein FliM